MSIKKQQKILCWVKSNQLSGEKKGLWAQAELLPVRTCWGWQQTPASKETEASMPTPESGKDFQQTSPGRKNSGFFLMTGSPCNPGWSETWNVGQVGLELRFTRLCPLSVGIKSVRHHTHLSLIFNNFKVLFLLYVYKYLLEGMCASCAGTDLRGQSPWD